MSDIQECGIVVPNDWVPLPIEPADDVRGWSKRTAAELQGRSKGAGYNINQSTLRRDLRSRAEDSRSREPFYAFCLYPDGFDVALATLEVDLIHPDDTVPEITLDWLAETFSTDDFGPPNISRIELPIGHAVRIRQNFAAGKRSRRSPGILMETLTYGVLPTGAETALILLMSWTVPGLSEEMEKAADSIAETLTVGFG
ncbi:hypothetical protein ACFXAS_17870 [Streptomyces sp. NPDC059459]|uniref:hypothetical protein n=1 Tax=Streptomyces sp. NPDC059459 TaxID=3346839 RepID=UPI00369C6B0F